MKKVALILALVLAGMFSLNAQERMKFMGKSMDCTAQEMSTYLQSKGFEYTEQTDNTIFFKGTFLGYQNCTIALGSEPDTLSICIILLPKRTSQDIAKGDYDCIVARLSDNYGSPPVTDEGGSLFSAYSNGVIMVIIEDNQVALFYVKNPQQERMKFMGKSMDCTMEEMSKHLQGRGFKYYDKGENWILLKGTFQGYLNCDIVLRTDYGVLGFCRIVLPEKSYSQSWNELYTEYSNMVNRLKEKYGEPKSEERFDDEPSYSFSDYQKMNHVEEGKCHYESYFLVGDYGYILVYIDSSKRVFVDYYDISNRIKIEQMQNDEL